MHHSFNMKTFEIYFVFIIFTMGTLLAACSGYELKKFYNDMLELHNKYRRLHGACELFYDNELSTKAVECKELYNLGNNEDVIIIDGISYSVYKSKNIAYVSAEDVFFSWYNEEQNYDYDSKFEQWNAEHFTQIVWKETETVGFAMLERSGETWFIAAYFPAGNQVDQYSNNVGKLTKEVN